MNKDEITEDFFETLAEYGTVYFGGKPYKIEPEKCPECKGEKRITKSFLWGLRSLECSACFGTGIKLKKQ